MGLERASLPGGDLIPGYLRFVAERAAELVKECLGRLTPVGIVYGQGRCKLAAYRDFFDEGQKQFCLRLQPWRACGRRRARRARHGRSGRPLAAVVNYACHSDDSRVGQHAHQPGLPWVPCVKSSSRLQERRVSFSKARAANSDRAKVMWATLRWPTATDATRFCLTLGARALPAAARNFRYTGPVVSGATLGAWAHEPLPAQEAERKRLWQLWRWREPLPFRPGQPKAEQVETELKQFQADEEAARAVAILGAPPIAGRWPSANDACCIGFRIAAR